MSEKSAPSAKKYRDTSLQAEGAEYLVVARLFLSGISAFKAPYGMKGYDVVAAAPDLGTSCRIQVKCRWGGNVDGFFLGNLDCEFVALVAPYLGPGPETPASGSAAATKVWLFPADLLAAHIRNPETSPKIQLTDIRRACTAPPEPGAPAGTGLDQFCEDWERVRSHLGLSPAGSADGR